MALDSLVNMLLFLTWCLLGLSPIRFGDKHIAGSQGVFLRHAETPYPIQVLRPRRRWSHHPCKMSHIVNVTSIRCWSYWISPTFLALITSLKVHIIFLHRLLLPRPLARKKWKSVKSGSPTSWPTDASGRSTTCLRFVSYDYKLPTIGQYNALQY